MKISDRTKIFTVIASEAFAERLVGAASRREEKQSQRLGLLHSASLHSQ